MKNLFKKHYKKIALVLSLCLFIIWGILGTGASLAWFRDVSPTLNNIFHFADFDLEVSHRLTDGAWELVNNQTKLFNEEALYEPGYTQIVYLKVKNNGTKAFNVYTAINVNGYTTATNVFGQPFSLQDYLKFGITISSTENQMKNSVANREIASQLANMPLHNYHTNTVVLNPNQEQFIALVVHMPKDVTNIANYRGSTIPKVELGLTVKASQTT